MTAENTMGLTWMSHIQDSKNLSEINIPGTHDSGTKFVSHNQKHFRCQELSVEEQLKIGVRYLDIRCCAQNDGKPPLIKHSDANCLKEKGDTKEDNLLTLRDVLETIESFLKSEESSQETVLLQIKNEGGNSKDSPLVKYLAQFIQQSDWIWAEDRLPLLSEVRGKAVLIRRFTYSSNYSGGLTEKDFGINLSSWDTECHGKSKAGTNTYVNVNNRALVQDRYMVGGGEKYDLILRAIKEANNRGRDVINKWVINLTSCIYNTPESAAEAINERLMKEPLIRKNNKLGTFVMDFVNEDLVCRIYSSNNEILP